MGKNNRDRKAKTGELGALSKWTKAKMFGVEFNRQTFDDALEVVYWIRQVIAVVVGLAWGLVPVTGAFGLIIYAAITTLSMYIYTHKLVILDEDDFAPLDVMKEGFMPALGMFLATWILVYTQLHGIGAAE